MDCAGQKTNFHFIAIGGVGMSGLAKYLLEKGYSVSGSDVSEGKYFSKVRDLGAVVSVGHNERNLPKNSVVIASTAIKEDNPELKKAKELSMKIFHRSDLLKYIAEDFQRTKGMFIGFSGTHGKTTTSGLASYVLAKSDLLPSYVVGGFIPEYETNAKADNGKYFVAELDESDGTILKYSPDVTVINNLEVDHIDFYKAGLSSLVDAFTTFLGNLNPQSKVVINKDCNGCQQLIEKNQNISFVTFGKDNADYTFRNVEYLDGITSFEIYRKNEFLIQIRLSIHGEHNVYNALAVVCSLVEAGIDINKVKDCFSRFTGMGRRYQNVGCVDGIQIVDDYAHHPSEISATLSMARACNNKKRLVAVFQPHRYTRLHGLYNEFLKCFSDADKVIVLDTYAASENPIEGHTSEEFANELNKTFGKDGVVYISGKISDIVSEVTKELRKDDIVITLGAGDVTKLGALILNAKGS